MGVGTSIRLKIPLTLAVVPALVIEIDQIRLAIPQLKLQELLLLDLNEDGHLIEEVNGNIYYRLRGQILPLIDLSRIFQNRSERSSFTEGRESLNIAVLRFENGLFGLIIDQVKDTADIVVKPFSSFFKDLIIYSGATILGNGDVALILDSDGLAQYTQLNLGFDKLKDLGLGEENTRSEQQLSFETNEYLIFLSFSDEVCAAPLSLIHRLEEFKRSEIQKTDREWVLPYRGGLISLIHLDTILKNNSTVTKTLNMDVDSLPERIQVFVSKKRDRFFGFMVKEILDIQTLRSDPEPFLRERIGLLGTLLDEKKKSRTVLDVLGLMNLSMGEVRESNKKSSRPQLSGEVLVVEDTPFFYRQIEKLLVPLGIQLTHAENGEVALSLLRDQGRKFQLILSDIEMPVMDGWKLATEIKQDTRLKTIPLVALTTRFSKADQEKGRNIGFDHYLEKINQEEILGVLESYLRGERRVC